MAVAMHRRLWTADEYHRLIDVGILGKEDRVELLEGEIVEMTPIGPRHASAVSALDQLFQQQVGGAAIVSVQNPIRLSERSEPQPDLAILVGREDRYWSETPGPGDVLIVVEVADSTSPSDRRWKLPLYARAGVPEAWLLDLDAGTIEVHTVPSAGGYKRIAVYQRDDTIETMVAGKTVRVPVASIIRSG